MRGVVRSREGLSVHAAPSPLLHRLRYCYTVLFSVWNQLHRNCRKLGGRAFPKALALQPDSLSQHSGSQPCSLPSCYTLPLLLGLPRSGLHTHTHTHGVLQIQQSVIWVGNLLWENWQAESTWATARVLGCCGLFCFFSFSIFQPSWESWVQE